MPNVFSGALLHIKTIFSPFEEEMEGGGKGMEVKWHFFRTTISINFQTSLVKKRCFFFSDRADIFLL